ncbi:ATP-binding protein, partial [Streptomyces sp. IBSBF 3136]|uniref:ATP-binding protein n=1 Tax=Streptomyces sp. IBSBF 3136 TaxID=2903524 RepID=UPI003FA6C59D
MGDQEHVHTGADRTDQPESPAQAAPSFPAQLRRLRRERGLSLADLARQTHYSKGYLSKIETGVKRATVDVARQCDHVLRAEGELLRLVRQTAPAEDGGQAADTGAAACPYRGLAAFTPQDAAWFFGRERATAALVERVFQRLGGGPLLLVAPSGAGKSSLLNAGLVPALQRPGGFPMPGADRWPVVALTPTAHPLDELIERTAKVLGGDLDLTAARLADRPEALLDAVRARSDDGPPGP